MKPSRRQLLAMKALLSLQSIPGLATLGLSLSELFGVVFQRYLA